MGDLRYTQRMTETYAPTSPERGESLLHNAPFNAKELTSVEGIRGEVALIRKYVQTLDLIIICTHGSGQSRQFSEVVASSFPHLKTDTTGLEKFQTKLPRHLVGLRFGKGDQLYDTLVSELTTALASAKRVYLYATSALDRQDIKRDLVEQLTTLSKDRSGHIYIVRGSNEQVVQDQLLRDLLHEK